MWAADPNPENILQEEHFWSCVCACVVVYVCFV